MLTSTFETPDISHITTSDANYVYEPAEDSFLFLDALQSDYEELKKSKPNICLEVGCGSGVCITFLAKMLGQQAAVYWCTDINPHAVCLAKKTAQQNGIVLEAVQTDLMQCFEARLAGEIDVLLFNPPYVVTPSEEVGGNGIEASWAGGLHGREVIDRFLPIVPKFLSKSGVLYLVVVKENKPEEIGEIMASHNFEMTTVLTRRSGPELLSVLKFRRKLTDR
ncbi:hypothetical protein FSP39_006238 [Pinctada imbricata]|uniref:Methyltransferase HEMK2 n=1 Tax=Pinctada imbricata TaxID=66713 RepID=A0AA89BN11_PINIB|nr:hypothetical protein FSP39_006238 [Pinctada imbricata]